MADTDNRQHSLESSRLAPDGALQNVLMTSLVALVSALFVSTAAVLLQPRYAAQQSALRQASMANLIESIPSLSSLVLASDADSLQTQLIDLDSGCRATEVSAAEFDARTAENDPEQSRALTTEDGDAQAMLKRRSDLEKVHLLFDKEQLQMAILPVHGPGYQSTLYAWLVLDKDLSSIIALSVTEHAETPGIGSRVEDPAWQRQWTDKQLLDESGELVIRVVKNADDTPYQVDAISGATRTSLGVSNMVRFWTGPLGFGPFLELQRRGEPC